MCNFIIGIAEMKTAKSPDTLTTLGLGSCIGLVLYDSVVKIGGMVHIMLPESRGSDVNKAKYADTGIDELLSELVRSGAKRERLTAKLAGGANMFGTICNDNMLCVGERNIETCHELLQDRRIPITGEETGGSVGRTIEFSCDTGALMIRTAWPITKKFI